MNRIILAQLEERTLVSLVRTLIYLTMAACVSLGHADYAALLHGLILGAVLADWMTWFVRSLMQLPTNLAHGAYEAAVNLVFAVWFFRGVDLRVSDDGTGLISVFFTFMLVLGLKAGYYGLQDVQAQLQAD